MPSQNAIFTQGNLMRHVVTMSLTTSIGLMAMFAVDLVDMIFISLLGETAMAAAAGYAGTILFFTNSINIGLSIAAGALVAKAVGADRYDDAREYATSVAFAAIITGLVLPFLLLPFMDTFLSLLGADAETAQLARSYLWIVMPSMGVLGIAMVAMAVLRAYGGARPSMYAMLLGGVVNAILDPIFIFGFDMGLQGAAIASVFARLATVFAALFPAITRYNSFTMPSLPIFIRDFSAVSKIALPAVMTNIATPFAGAIVVREMAQHGSEAVAGMAVVGRLVPVAFAIILALSGAVGPIIGQNFGAGRMDRVREVFMAALKFTAIYVVVATFILFLSREWIASLFGVDGIAQSIIYLFCGPLALSYIFNGAMFVANASFNNLGHPIYSTWINWGKSTLGTWPFIIMGSIWWGAEGILIGQAIGMVVFSVIAVLLALRVMRTPSSKPYTPKPFDRHRRQHIMFSHWHW